MSKKTALLGFWANFHGAYLPKYWSKPKKSCIFVINIQFWVKWILKSINLWNLKKNGFFRENYFSKYFKNSRIDTFLYWFYTEFNADFLGLLHYFVKYTPWKFGQNPNRFLDKLKMLFLAWALPSRKSRKISLPARCHYSTYRKFSSRLVWGQIWPQFYQLASTAVTITRPQPSMVLS